MKNKKIIWVIAVVVIVLLLFFIFFKQPASETDSGKAGRETTETAEELPNLETSDDVFNEIENSLEQLE